MPPPDSRPTPLLLHPPKIRGSPFPPARRSIRPSLFPIPPSPMCIQHRSGAGATPTPRACRRTRILRASVRGSQPLHGMGFRTCNHYSALFCCGEGEIRTHDTLPYDGFQDRCLKPLGHLTFVDPRRIGLLPPPCHGGVIPFYYGPLV